MEAITDYLSDGVGVHHYSDASGVVLFNDHSTQMLTIYLTLDELVHMCRTYSDKGESALPTDQVSLIKALQRQHFLQFH
jgi:hypothetical protein